MNWTLGWMGLALSSNRGKVFLDVIFLKKFIQMLIFGIKCIGWSGLKVLVFENVYIGNVRSSIGEMR